MRRVSPRSLRGEILKDLDCAGIGDKKAHFVFVPGEVHLEAAERSIGNRSTKGQASFQVHVLRIGKVAQRRGRHFS